MGKAGSVDYDTQKLKDIATPHVDKIAKYKLDIQKANPNFDNNECTTCAVAKFIFENKDTNQEGIVALRRLNKINLPDKEGYVEGGKTIISAFNVMLHNAIEKLKNNNPS